MNVKQLFQSKTFVGILYGIGIFLFLLIVFQAGVFVGYHKAGFSYRFGENYYRAFGGDRHLGLGMNGPEMGEGLIAGHGTIGTILKIELPTLVIEGQDKVEKVVRLTDQTVIREFRGDVKSTDLKVGMNIVALGSPDPNGEIAASLIRVFPDFNKTPVAPTPVTK